MEWRNPDKEMGSSAKRSLSGTEEEQKKKEDSSSNVIHEGTIFNPSPDGHQTRTRRDPDPDPPDPNPIRSQPEPVTRYRECQKNHAAHLGTHVLDGCGEFMPDGDAGTLESLNCAACGCHRNFHRKEASSAAVSGLIVAQTPSSNFQISFNARHQHTNILTPFPFRQAPAAANHHHRRFSDQAAPSAMMNFGEGGGDASSEDLNLFRSDGEGYRGGGGGSSRKRFRTKFTEEQKERMMELAEKIGWRIQKQDESDVQQFCATTGVKRQVFKVWMHNNKQAMKRKDLQS